MASSVYLQYAHVRLSSIERKNPNVVLPSDPLAIKTDLLTEDKAHDIVFALALFPEVVATAYQYSEPSAIVTYLFRLAHAISGAWDQRASRTIPPLLPLGGGLPPLGARSVADDRRSLVVGQSECRRWTTSSRSPGCTCSSAPGTCWGPACDSSRSVRWTACRFDGPACLPS